MSILFSFQVEGRGFRNTWLAVFQNIQQVKPVDATIGFTSLGVILLLRVRYIHTNTGDATGKFNFLYLATFQCWQCLYLYRNVYEK